MTDKELLELAAKAMGYKYMNGALWDGRDVVEYEWHPQDMDDQALRLVVKLKLVVHVWDDGSGTSVAKTLPNGNDPDGESEDWSFNNTNDPYAATRRAIVRAAAEIGKAL